MLLLYPNYSQTAGKIYQNLYTRNMIMSFYLSRPWHDK